MNVNYGGFKDFIDLIQFSTDTGIGFVNNLFRFIGGNQ